MKSTGEVMGISHDFDVAFAKSQIAAGVHLPDSGAVFISVKDSDKQQIVPAAAKLIELGFTLVATKGTAAYLEAAGIPVERINKVAEGRPHVLDRMIDGGIDLLFNTTEGAQSLADSKAIRAMALRRGVPYFTTAAASTAACHAIGAMRGRPLDVRSLQNYSRGPDTGSADPVSDGGDTAEFSHSPSRFLRPQPSGTGYKVDIFQYDADLGYRFLPDIRRRIQHENGGYIISTNSEGFRDVEWQDEGAPAVLVFGDSFTAGDGVSNGSRWSDALGTLIPGHRFRNYGLPGTGTDQQYLAWRKFGKDKPARFVLAAVLVENIRRVTTAYRPATDVTGRTLFRPKPYYTLEDGELVRHHDPVPKEMASYDEITSPVDKGGRFPVMRALAGQLGLRDFLQKLTSYQPTPDYDSPDTPGWQLLRAILKRWSDECAVPMAIMPLPLYQHVEGTADATAYQQRFRELGEELGRPIIDPLPELAAHDAQTKRSFRFGKDVHLTAAGHAAVAKAVAAQLKPLLGS
jgi:carbamoyltransferase